MNEVILAYLQLPFGVKGLVTPTPEGDYQVILNSRHSAATQRQTFEHELRHILLNHFSQDIPLLDPLETQANMEGFLQKAIQQAEELGISQCGAGLLPAVSALRQAGEAPPVAAVAELAKTQECPPQRPPERPLPTGSLATGLLLEVPKNNNTVCLSGTAGVGELTQTQECPPQHAPESAPPAGNAAPLTPLPRHLTGAMLRVVRGYRTGLYY